MSKCCKHIAVAMIELPHAEFSHTSHWELRDQASLEDLSVDDRAPAVAIATEPATTLLVRHYAQGIYNVMNIMDVVNALSPIMRRYSMQ